MFYQNDKGIMRSARSARAYVREGEEEREIQRGVFISEQGTAGRRIEAVVLGRHSISWGWGTYGGTALYVATLGSRNVVWPEAKVEVGRGREGRKKKNSHLFCLVEYIEADGHRERLVPSNGNNAPSCVF